MNLGSSQNQRIYNISVSAQGELGVTLGLTQFSFCVPPLILNYFLPSQGFTFILRVFSGAPWLPSRWAQYPVNIHFSVSFMQQGHHQHQLYQCHTAVLVLLSIIPIYLLPIIYTRWLHLNKISSFHLPCHRTQSQAESGSKSAFLWHISE